MGQPNPYLEKLHCNNDQANLESDLEDSDDDDLMGDEYTDERLQAQVQDMVNQISEQQAGGYTTETALMNL